ncbi:MAG: serine/threonine-protein kinase [Myxococcota bacterium]
MSPLDPASTPVVGKYEILEHLGSGAMASVYKVRHTQLKAVYALKILDGALGRMQDRLMREGRVQATLRHPNVVSVHDVLEVDGQPALLMEYVSGPTLAAYILANEPLEVDEIDRFARGIIKGVRAAHAEGHLHRDLKPANILLQPLDGEYVPKIADFGLVKVLGDPDDMTQTRTGQLLGSPAYMSPEQTISATDLDERTDVWALGAVLYQLCTGKLAFPHRDLVTVFSMIRSGDFRDPRGLRERIPDRMWNAILGAMTVDTERRIQSCEQLLDVWTGRVDFEAATNKSVETMVDDFDGPAPPTADFPPEETRPTRAADPTASTSSRNTPMTWAGFAAAVAVILLAVLVGTQLRGGSDTGVSKTPTAPAPVEVAPPSAPVPTPPPAPVPAPTPDPEVPAPPVVAPRPVGPVGPRTAPDPRPPVPAPPTPVVPVAPDPTPAVVMATFAVQGDAERVWLVRGGTHYDPGEVAPGRYTVSARFPGRPLAPVEGVVVDLAAGDRVTIECRAGFLTCRAL